MFEQGDEIKMDTVAPPPPPDKSNRTFIMAAGILGGVVFISIVCMALYALVYLPRQKAAQSAQQATIMAQNALISQAMTQTMQAAARGTQVEATKNALPTKTLTPFPTYTPVIAYAATSTPLFANTALTSTLSALNTQVATTIKTSTATPTPAMPTSGFADEFGLPGLALMAVALVVVILLARRLRSVPTR